MLTQWVQELRLALPNQPTRVPSFLRPLRHKRKADPVSETSQVFVLGLFVMPEVSHIDVFKGIITASLHIYVSSLDLC